MAAATVNSSTYGILGNRRFVVANLNAATTNTWVTGLSQIDAVLLTGSAAATTPAATVSGGTVTLVLGASDTSIQAFVSGV